MISCIGCKYYDDSVDGCNADEHCYQEGFDNGWNELKSRVSDILDNPNIAIYHKEKRIKEIMER